MVMVDLQNNNAKVEEKNRYLPAASTQQKELCVSQQGRGWKCLGGTGAALGLLALVSLVAFAALLLAPPVIPLIVLKGLFIAIIAAGVSSELLLIPYAINRLAAKSKQVAKPLLPLPPAKPALPGPASTSTTSAQATQAVAPAISEPKAPPSSASPVVERAIAVIKLQEKNEALKKQNEALKKQLEEKEENPVEENDLALKNKISSLEKKIATQESEIAQLKEKKKERDEKRDAKVKAQAKDFDNSLLATLEEGGLLEKKPPEEIELEKPEPEKKEVEEQKNGSDPYGVSKILNEWDGEVGGEGVKGEEKEEPKKLPDNMDALLKNISEELVLKQSPQPSGTGSEKPKGGTEGTEGGDPGAVDKTLEVKSEVKKEDE